jgi:hypothetical protein
VQVRAQQHLAVRGARQGPERRDPGPGQPRIDPVPSAGGSVFPLEFVGPRPRTSAIAGGTGRPRAAAPTAGAAARSRPVRARAAPGPAACPACIARSAAHALIRSGGRHAGGRQRRSNGEDSLYFEHGGPAAMSTGTADALAGGAQKSPRKWAWRQAAAPRLGSDEGPGPGRLKEAARDTAVGITRQRPVNYTVRKADEDWVASGLRRQAVPTGSS